MTKRRFAAILISALAIFGAAAGATATAASAGTTASAPSTWYHQ